MNWWILAALVFAYLYCNISHASPTAELHEPFDLEDGSDDMHQNADYIQDFVVNASDPSVLNCTAPTGTSDFDILADGRVIIAHANKTIKPGFYYIHNGSVIYCDENDPHNVPKLSEEFFNCGHILIEPDEYELLENGSIYIEIYQLSYPPTHYMIKKHGAYICVPPYEKWKDDPESFDEVQKFSQTSNYVTFVGLLVSILSLTAHLMVFCCVPEVRNLPGCCLASLSFSLLMAYLCFLVAFLMKSKASCIGLGMCVYYFFLTSFFWMNAISFDFWRSFRVVVRELRISSHRLPRMRFSLYSLYSWGLPALFTIIVKLFDTAEILPIPYRPSFGHPYCWFGQRKALLTFFAAPLIGIMFINLVFFADVIYVINRATMKRGTAHDANLKKRFAMFTRLALIMGLTWIFGIAAGFVDRPFLWYIFIVLNTLQGLFIFAVFMGSSKVRSLCFKEYKNRGKRTSTSVRTVSATL